MWVTFYTFPVLLTQMPRLVILNNWYLLLTSDAWGSCENDAYYHTKNCNSIYFSKLILLIIFPCKIPCTNGNACEENCKKKQTNNIVKIPVLTRCLKWKKHAYGRAQSFDERWEWVPWIIHHSIRAVKTITAFHHLLIILKIRISHLLVEKLFGVVFRDGIHKCFKICDVYFGW